MALYPRYYNYYSNQVLFTDGSTQKSAGISAAAAEAQVLTTIANIIGTGTQANLQSVLPLNLGEIYVATDTGNLFIGTPGVGVGYLQVGDTRAMNETLLQLLMEIRAMRLALTSLACQGAQANPRDFDPQALASDAEIADRAQI